MAPRRSTEAVVAAGAVVSAARVMQKGFVARYVKSEDDLALATHLLREIMAQHLRVRNEIYGYPLSAERLAAIDRGEIEPWAMAAATAAGAA